MEAATEAPERRRTILRPSISRAEYGTSQEWMECVDCATRRIYGTPGMMQQEWIETFIEVPPKESTIFAGRDLELIELVAA